MAASSINQQAVSLPVQLDTLGVVARLPGSLHQALEGLIAPAGDNRGRASPEEIVGIKNVGDQPNWVPIRAGGRHWDIFERLCRAAGLTGNLVPDAYLTILAIGTGSTWVTTDRAHGRFAGLTCRHPLEG